MKAYGFALVALLGVACSERVTRPSTRIAYRGDDLLVDGRRFDGILEERFDATDTHRETRYRNGRRDGLETEYFGNGQLAARRTYRRDRKVGIHAGWFRDGRRRFHHEYAEGESHGEAWEWHPSGALALYARFEGGRLLGKKMWRDDGQIYMNYVFSEDRAFGTPGAKLCLQVRGEP